MAVGDVKSDVQALASGVTLAIQPTSTEEWVIHNIYGEALTEIEVYDGTDRISLDKSSTTGGWWSNLQLHVRNGQYVRIYNLTPGTKRIGYDGIVTHI